LIVAADAEEPHFFFVFAEAATEVEADAEFVDEHCLAVGQVVFEWAEHREPPAAGDADVGLVESQERIEAFGGEAAAEAIEAADRFVEGRVEFEAAVGEAAAEEEFAIFADESPRLW
jgi:hypothetical protein